MTYSKITKEQFDEMQFDAGVLVRSFSIDSPAIQDEDIVCATTGGFSIVVEPSYEDTGDGVYMMPPGTVEMMELTGWAVEASFTSLGVSPESIKFALGAADIDETDIRKIVPRARLKHTDFSDVWWIGDRLDGGFVAINMQKVLGNGFSIQTTKNGKGQVSVELTCHVSIEDDTDAVPVEIYSIDNRPWFNVMYHQFLYVDNADEDVFDLDEETGMLTITQNSDWNYSLNVNTGRMEVSRD